MKHEWRKQEKQYYLPKNHPVEVFIPRFSFFSIHGKGNPNDPFFAEYISVLYALSYAVKMSPKQGISPDGYYDYTVYPLEGIWDLSEAAKEKSEQPFDKDDLVFELMIRQPDFVDKEFAANIIQRTKKKKPHQLLDDVTFKAIEEGHCIQMLHLGPFDNEPESFRLMEEHVAKNALVRVSGSHREIYLSDVRKVVPEKLKTVLRFKVVER